MGHETKFTLFRFCAEYVEYSRGPLNFIGVDTQGHFLIQWLWAILAVKCVYYGVFKCCRKYRKYELSDHERPNKAGITCGKVITELLSCRGDVDTHTCAHKCVKSSEDHLPWKSSLLARQQLIKTLIPFVIRKISVQHDFGDRTSASKKYLFYSIYTVIFDLKHFSA